MAAATYERVDRFDVGDPRATLSSNTFTKDTAEDKSENLCGMQGAILPLKFSQMDVQSSSSSYMMADDHSRSRDIEHWMNGSQVPTPTSPTTFTATPTENTTFPNRTSTGVQRSLFSNSYGLESTGIWYFLAMVLPLFSITNCSHWRCTPSLVLNSAELMMTQLSRVCSRVRGQLRQLSQDQVAREIFATAMDIVLVIYAIGFLILSMYQASIFV